MSNKELFQTILKNKLSDLSHEITTKTSDYAVLNSINPPLNGLKNRNYETI